MGRRWAWQRDRKKEIGAEDGKKVGKVEGWEEEWRGRGMGRRWAW